MIVSPVYTNKWQFYMKKLNLIDDTACNADVVKFSWFSCGKPYVDTTSNMVLQVDRYVMLFNNSTGKSYNITFDATDDKPCTLLIVDNTFNDVTFTSAVKKGYQGIVQYKESSTCDLVCPEVQMMIDPNVMRESKMCPFITFAKTHYPMLEKICTTDKELLSKRELNAAKPGKVSLKLQKLLVPFFTL